MLKTFKGRQSTGANAGKKTYIGYIQVKHLENFRMIPDLWHCNPKYSLKFFEEKQM